MWPLEGTQGKKLMPHHTMDNEHSTIKTAHSEQEAKKREENIA